MTDGLKESIRWFALAAATRRVADPASWTTMLIHTSSNISAHEKLYEVVCDFIGNLDSDWRACNDEWCTLWKEENPGGGGIPAGVGGMKPNESGQGALVAPL